MHRDSSQFRGISPFEGEMRRRLWWYLITHEARAAEDYGLAVFTATSPAQVRFPLNLDDAMLWPDMKVLPAEREDGHWTEMTKSLIVIKTMQTKKYLYDMLLGLSEAALGSNTNQDGMEESKRHEIVHHHVAQMERMLEKCNAAVPIQNATLIVSRLLLRKLDFVSRIQFCHRLAESVKSNSIPPAKRYINNENIIDACEILELELSMQSESLLGKYCWAAETYTQFHVIQFILLYLRAEPSSPYACRAWTALDASFEKELARQRRQDQPSSPNRAVDSWGIIWKLRDQARLAAGKPCDTAEWHRDLGEELCRASVTEDGGDCGFTVDPEASFSEGVLDWNMLLDPLMVEPFPH